MSVLVVLGVLGGLGVLAVMPWWFSRPLAPRTRASRAVRRRSPAEVAPDPAVLLDLVDVALASGASIPDALHGLGVAVAPSSVGRELTAASTSLRLGASWSATWAECSPVLVPVANALEPAWLDGADPGPLVRRAAAGVRARRQREAREAAERLGARLVLPLGLCFLPAFVLLSLVPVLLSGGASLLGASLLGASLPGGPHGLTRDHDGRVIPAADWWAHRPQMASPSERAVGAGFDSGREPAGQRPEEQGS